METNYQEQMALFRYRTILPLLDGALSAQDEMLTIIPAQRF